MRPNIKKTEFCSLKNATEVIISCPIHKRGWAVFADDLTEETLVFFGLLEGSTMSTSDTWAPLVSSPWLDRYGTPCVRNGYTVLRWVSSARSENLFSTQLRSAVERQLDSASSAANTLRPETNACSDEYGAAAMRFKAHCRELFMDYLHSFINGLPILGCRRTGGRRRRASPNNGLGSRHCSWLAMLAVSSRDSSK